MGGAALDGAVLAAVTRHTTAATLTATSPDGTVPADPAMPFVVLGLFAVMVLVMLVVAGALLWAQLRPPAQPVTGPDGVIRLQGHLLPVGQVLSLSAETYGRVEVTPWELIWIGETGQVWRVPIPALVVRPATGLFRLPGLIMELPGVGAWRLQVSDRRINRFARNTIKAAREARLTNTLARTLLARGARPFPPRAG